MLKSILIIATAAALSTAIAGAATLLFDPQTETDYSVIAPPAETIHSRLSDAQVSLTEAIQLAEQSGNGIAKSARAVDVADQPFETWEVLCYTNQTGKRVTISAGDGTVISTQPVQRFPGAPVEGEWTETDSGLKYYTLRQGEGPQPASDDIAKIHFTMWLVNGKKLQSSRDQGRAVDFPLNTPQPRGLAEGIRTMHVGGKRKLIVPYELAFGEAGNPPALPPKATLIIDVELLDIVDYKNVPGTANLPGEEVAGEPTTTESGLSYYVLEEGTGPSPQAADRVKVHYTGWLTDGTKFDSSVDRGQPAQFPVQGVIPGWTEALIQMKVGGKRKLIIPADLAYGPQGRPPTIPPNATLVFDVQLLEIVGNNPGG